MHLDSPGQTDAKTWARTGQLKPKMDSDTACLQCHKDMSARLVAHTHHAADSSGSRCYNCHMPYTSYGLLKALRSHRIIAAVPEREDPRDVLASLSAKSIDALPQGAKVGTGSQRRRCQLLAAMGGPIGLGDDRDDRMFSDQCAQRGEREFGRSVEQDFQSRWGVWGPFRGPLAL